MPGQGASPDGAQATARGVHVMVRGFRSIGEVDLRLEPTLAIIGEDGAAESEVLRAVRVLVDRAARPTVADFHRADLPIDLALTDAEER